MSVLVTGFGSFPGVPVNPTEALARQIDGQQVHGVPVVGRVLPVSFRRGPDEAIRLARAHGARLVVGLGVAVARSEVCVERVGIRVELGKADVDGEHACLLDGPEHVRATLDTDRLAEVLGARISDDAGRYVCNAWLYRVARALPVPVGFVHVPASGLPPQVLLRGLAALIG